MSDVTRISAAAGQLWWLIVGVCLATVAVFDYLSGYELSFAVFYLIPVLIAAWYAGWRAACVVSAISVMCSLLGDLASGAWYSSMLVFWWNMVILLGFYLAIVTVLLKLKASRQGLEMRVRERTAALVEEIAARERLEEALLDASEREQRRIGHDLHDSICQRLTATAMAAQVLSGKLEARKEPAAVDAGRLVALIEDGIDLSRRLARGLAPVELDADADGLATALRELGRHLREHGSPHCRVEISAHAGIGDPQVTTQLFRIAQEAARNAVRHGGGLLEIALRDGADGGFEMVVSDEGGGPARSARSAPVVATPRGGMGLHIMKHRASLIGATFEAGPVGQGFEVRVRVPASDTSNHE